MEVALLPYAGVHELPSETDTAWPGKPHLLLMSTLDGLCIMASIDLRASQVWSRASL